MHVNMETLMSHIVSSERTSRLPACFSYMLFSIPHVFCEFIVHFAITLSSPFYDIQFVFCGFSQFYGD